MNAFTKEDLKQFQAEPLNEKIQRSLAKIGEWYSRQNHQCYVSFSGGKDSTVLADLCAKWCKAIDKPLYLVFVNTGLEYPEIQKHVKFLSQWLRDKYGIEVNLEILRPELRFDEVIKKYGYPIISKEVSECVSQGRKSIESGSEKYIYRLQKLLGTEKDNNGNPSMYNMPKWKPLLETDFICSHMCCNVMKKKPSKEYTKRTGRKPITAQMASESRLREQQWLKNGCNGFNMKSPISNPMSFWTEQDVLQYIKDYNTPIASVYGEIEYADDPKQMCLDDFGLERARKLKTTGCSRTGCIFCGFGCHLEKEPSRFQRLKETHPRHYEYCLGGGAYDYNGIWKPNKDGLGMRHVFDELNRIYGKDFIKYE